MKTNGSLAYNVQGLLSVNEFKNIKMITELQKRFEADAYKQKMNYAGSAGIAAEQGFLAGIDFLQHLLQQTPCTTLRENLAQLLIEEQQLALRNKRRFLTKVYHNENARALERVIKMLDERQPVA